MASAVDLVIKNGRIIDGTGISWYHGDIAVVDNKIIAIGSLEYVDAKLVIDANGCVICPGFIDVHSHSDLVLLENPLHEPKVYQGVTTEFLGLDGLSYAPLSSRNVYIMRKYLSGLNGDPAFTIDGRSIRKFLEQFNNKSSINVAYFVPHGALRLECMDVIGKTATSTELANMKKVCARAMEEGAFGLSTALTYAPCVYSNTEELIELNKVVAEYNGCFVVHLRNCGDNFLDPIREVIEVARQTGVSAHISHLKPRAGYFGRASEIVSLLEETRREGIDITYDSYPYGEGGGYLLSLLPNWVFAEGLDSLEQKLSSEITRLKLHQHFKNREHVWTDTVIAGTRNDEISIAVGKSISEFADIIGKHPVDAVCDLLISEDMFVSTKGKIGPPESDLEVLMRCPVHMVASDGLMIGSHPHPRAYGTYGRYLGRYVREKGVLQLEEAIGKMTFIPAQKFGLNDRGALKIGMVADIVVFDPDTITDRATMDDGCQYTEGVKYVIVNGKMIFNGDGPIGILPGEALYHLDMKKIDK